MFESAKLEQHLDKEAFAREAPEIREALLNPQFDLVQSRAFQVIVIVAGLDGAGKGPVVKGLNSVLDARHINTYAMREPSDEEGNDPECGASGARCRPRGKSASSSGPGTMNRCATASWAEFLMPSSISGSMKSTVSRGCWQTKEPNDKYYARLKVIETLCARMKEVVCR